MLIVKKFGGTSVGNKERILNVAKRCIEDYQKGNDVVVVLSAMGKSTDELIDMAKDINPTPSKREMDMLMTTGEQVSVSLMAMAMGSLGVPAISLNAFQVAMHTTHRYGNAQLKRIDTDRIRNELEQRKIVLVTGFQGIDKFDNVTTLGRGGSDTTAVALAAALHADACEIYTDVDGVYTADPRYVKKARKLAEITYDEMLDLASLGAGVLHNTEGFLLWSADPFTSLFCLSFADGYTYSFPTGRCFKPAFSGSDCFDAVLHYVEYGSETIGSGLHYQLYLRCSAYYLTDFCYRD